ncbi:ribonuclease J [Aliidiomarina quisquiliarum]|uniref:ribonuclease J n=1 Tax=Aliidiomarina quisquiliarum TaxID=2938947 RepID=UPI00208F0DC4|nr:ribonuclease J [Aliidiomarina quisquiliarum]MCO4321041.1 ribonuclease J [Aliidiomarina quisquiliarum]
MNLNLFGHAGQWLMVDCGITFQEPLDPTNTQPSPSEVFDVVAADPEFIVQHKEHLAGIVITHAHEDHVGAIPYLWQRFQVPIYTTAFTAEVLRRKLAQTKLADKVPIVVVNTGDTQRIGVFDVQWLAITHSIPEPHGLMIKTPAGSIFHTADWKIDTDPVVGKGFQSRPFKRMGEQNITAMVCDSTNALRPGHSISENACYPGLKSLIESAEGRVVVSCFSSNIARLLTLGRIAKETGRYMALMGRSLQNMVSIARVTGHWDESIPLAEQRHIGFLPRNEILAVATGSQGEPRAALQRLANDSFRDLNLDKGDRILFSSMIIPGNEEPIKNLVKALKARGFEVFQAHETELPIHASGHPCQDELRQLYSWVKPQIAIPVHGEAEHIAASAAIAKECGVPIQMAGLNGDLYVLAPEPELRRNMVRTGRIPLVQ